MKKDKRIDRKLRKYIKWVKWAIKTHNREDLKTTRKDEFMGFCKNLIMGCQGLIGEKLRDEKLGEKIGFKALLLTGNIADWRLTAMQECLWNNVPKEKEKWNRFYLKYTIDILKKIDKIGSKILKGGAK